MEFFNFCCCCRKCSTVADIVLLLRSREWKEFHRRIGSTGPGLLVLHMPPTLHEAVVGTVPLLKPPISDLYSRCCISSCVECLCISWNVNFISYLQNTCHVAKHLWQAFLERILFTSDFKILTTCPRTCNTNSLLGRRALVFNTYPSFSSLTTLISEQWLCDTRRTIKDAKIKHFQGRSNSSNNFYISNIQSIHRGLPMHNLCKMSRNISGHRRLL
jgi:hypothetical protein